MNDILFSVIAEIDDSSRIRPFIDNYAEEAKGCASEVLLVGDVSDEDRAYLMEKTAEDLCIEVISEAANMPEGLNMAIDRAKGKLMSIAATSTEYKKGTLQRLISAYSADPSIKAISLEPRGYDVNGKVKRIVPFLLDRDSGFYRVDLKEEPDHWFPALFSVFFDREMLGGIRFDSSLIYEYRRLFRAELCTVFDSFYFLLAIVRTHAFIDRDYYNYHALYDPYWYTYELNMIAEKLLEIEDPNRINQRVLMDFIRLQFAANQDDRNKNILTGDDLRKYIDNVKALTQRLDDDIIVYLRDDAVEPRLPQLTNNMFLCIKYDTDHIDTTPRLQAEAYETEDGYVSDRYAFVTDTGAVLGKSDQLIVNVTALNRVNDRLVFDAVFKNSYLFDINDASLKIVGTGGDEYGIRLTEVYSLWKYFGVTVAREMTFRFEIPVEKPSSFRMSLTCGGREFTPELRFARPQARIRQTHRHNYWKTGNRIFRYDAPGRKIVISRSNPFRLLYCEVNFWKDIYERTRNKKRARAFIGLRILYFLTKPLYGHKNIWLTFDQLFKGGDNGEYFYRYVSDLKDGRQTLYYVINKDTKEYRELSGKYKTVLAYNSLKHKLISLHSDIIFTTRADVCLYAGFNKISELYFRNLFNFEAVCLQHGLSIQQIAQYQNRTFDNLKYYFCVSKYEIDNLSHPIYGYEDRSTLALTGAPRYDGLTGEAKKQIIISPTWRRNVTSGTNQKGSNHEYSSNFKDTAYYQIYNSLINDKRLIECAEETGYRLIYLIHPILSPQIKDFDTNDYLEILPGSEVNYEKILVESSLMLTDHSGIMYDFAYQRKPLVYYHPDELPPQYAAGGLDYETMGFGPVCRTREEVVDALCEMMRKECRLDPVYRERIEDFFEFDDQNNCERVFKAAKEFEKRIKNR